MSNCECHTHQNLFGDADEIPAVFSHTLEMDFIRNISGDELCKRLSDWLEALALWAVHNHCYVGHIKVFAESGEDFCLWLSTTGKGITIRNPHQDSGAVVRQGTVSVTAIVFGTDDKSLRTVVTDQWNERMQMR